VSHRVREIVAIIANYSELYLRFGVVQSVPTEIQQRVEHEHPQIEYYRGNYRRVEYRANRVQFQEIRLQHLRKRNVSQTNRRRIQSIDVFIVVDIVVIIIIFVVVVSVAFDVLIFFI
jgi:hypothetical protein